MDAETKTLAVETPAKLTLHFQLGDKLIDSATINPMTFQAYSTYVAEAFSMTEPDDVDTRLRRIRMARQVSYHAGGVTVPVTLLDVLELPIADARKIIAALNMSFLVGSPPGKIIRDGDGIDKAITFELGTPLQLGLGKEPIQELEFYVRKYGDVEDVMAEFVPAIQTMRLIKAVAKPMPGSLQRLSDGMLSQITLADGLTIMREILPSFLGSPAE